MPLSRVFASTGWRIGSWGRGLTHETTRSAHKVGFITKEKLPLEMDREPGKLVAPCSLRKGVFYLVIFLGKGSQVSGVEWSFDISLREHIQSPVKASCLLALWHFWGIPRGLWLVKSHVPLQDVGFIGDGGTGSFLSSDPPDPTPPCPVFYWLKWGLSVYPEWPQTAFLLISTFQVPRIIESQCSLLLEPNLQFILLWLFWRWCLVNYLPGLVSIWDPNSHEPLAPSWWLVSIGVKAHRHFWVFLYLECSDTRTKLCL
jgi:hypothetical protein